MKPIHSILVALPLLFACASVTAAEPSKIPAACPKKIAAPEPKSRVITLEQAYDMTLASDQSIRIAFYEILKANLLPWSALARMGPQVTGNTSYTTTRNTTNNYASSPEAAPTSTGVSYDTRFAGFVYSQPIFDASVFPAYRYGKLTAKAAKLQYQFTVRQTLFGVAQAYYNVLKLQQLVAVNQQTVDLANEQLGTAQARFNAGAVARIDVLRAESTLEGARNTLIQFQGALDISKNTLSNILNLCGNTNFTLAEPADEPDCGTAFCDSLNRAYKCREDLIVSAIGIEQQKALRGEVVAQYAPKVVAQLSTQWTIAAGDNSGHTHAEVGAISVQMPFLTGGQREIDLITANQNIAEARLRLESTAKSVEAEVKTAWENVQTGREALKALKAQVEAATQNYTDLEAQYQAGAATSLDAQTALRDLNNARTLLTNQVYDYQIALRDLERSDAAFQCERVEKAKIK